MIKAAVITDINIEGLHYYKDAPDEVAFLRDKHRHLFNIVCKFNVSNLNREVEIFICQSKILEFLYNKYGFPCDFESLSCEQIAMEILVNFGETGCFYVKVLEDGKGGAEVINDCR